MKYILNLLLVFGSPIVSAPSLLITHEPSTEKMNMSIESRTQRFSSDHKECGDPVIMLLAQVFTGDNNDPELFQYRPATLSKIKEIRKNYQKSLKIARLHQNYHIDLDVAPDLELISLNSIHSDVGYLPIKKVSKTSSKIFFESKGIVPLLYKSLIALGKQRF